MTKKTLVLGGSLNEKRYSNKAIKRLNNNNITTVAIGLKKGVVANTAIDTEPKQFKDIDTVTLYLNKNNQKKYYNYIINLKPKRVIFNPGTENSEFVALLKSHQIKTDMACTLVLLATNQY